MLGTLLRIAPRRAPLVLVSALVLLVALPAAGAAQYGFLGALGNRFSDLSFFANVGRLSSSTQALVADQVRHFGLEVLFVVGTVSEPEGPPREPDDSVRLVWREMRVERTAEGVDTIYFYDVEEVENVQPMRDIWTFELGLGYGQLTGFDSRDPALDLRGAMRDLPSVSIYASYEPLGTYLGLRSGLIELTGLQIIDSNGASYRGDARSFMAGAALGQAWSVAGFNLFVEGSYTLRDFPSVEWFGGEVPLQAPRSLDLSGWSIGAGLQFGVGG